MSRLAHKLNNAVVSPPLSSLAAYDLLLAANHATSNIRQHSVRNTAYKHSVQHGDSKQIPVLKHGKKCAFGVFLKNTRIGRFALTYVVDFYSKMVPGGGIEPPTRGFSMEAV